MRTFRLSFLALALALSGLLLISQWAQKNVTLVVDGKARSLRTNMLTVGQLLASEGIYLNPGDDLLPGAQEWLQPGATVSIQRGAQILISVDGKSRSLLTSERRPANLLALAGVSLYPGDQILVAGQPVAPDEPLPSSTLLGLQVRRAHPVTLLSGSRVRNLTSRAATLGQALWEAGIRLKAGDRLVPSPDTPLNGPVEAHLTRSKALNVHFSTGEVSLRSTAATVGEALAEAGMALQGLDYTDPPASAPLPPDGEIRVVRVQEGVSMEIEPIAFGSETQPLPDLEIDQQRIVEPGTYGLTARRVRVRYEDGIETARQVEAEYRIQEPRPRIVGYGTKIVPHSLDTGAGTIEYWRSLNMYAVSYNPTSAGGTITASGLPLEKGVVAVDPNYIPLGTRLYIPGYGPAVAADTGGGVKGRIIDLGYSDHDYVPWHQWVTVYFLWPPPQNVVWVIP